MTTLAFFVAGTPVPQGSMRAFGSRIIQSPEVKAWRGEVTAEALAAAEAAGWEEPWDGPCALSAIFWLARPRTVKRRWPTHSHAGAGDIDKLTRGLLDALSPRDAQLRVLTNDARIVRIVIEKRYAGDDRPAGVHIELTPLEAQ